MKIIQGMLVVLLLLLSTYNGMAIDNETGEMHHAGSNPASEFHFATDPNYDSGWRNIELDQDLLITHNLGGNPDNYVVNLQGYNSTFGNHQWMYGGNRTYITDHLEYYGFYWYALNGTSIKIKRNLHDGALTPQVRIRIWVVEDDDFNSGWFDISQGKELSLSHDLGGSYLDYVVDMQFKNPGSLGINNKNYGLDTYTSNGTDLIEEGTAWKNLTNSSITVVRANGDLSSPKARIRIWKVTKPDYDSHFQSILRDDSRSFPHNLGGPWNDFVVDLQFEDTKADGIDGNGVNQMNFGGNSVDLGGIQLAGAWLHSVYGKRLIVSRGADDFNVDEVRVRIWAKPEPKYDSGWKPIGKNEDLTITHNLGGNPDHYVIDLAFKDTNADGVIGSGINQKGYGGNLYIKKDSWNHGVYWYSLTKTSLKVHREGDDTDADEVRVRMWVPPAPTHDTGWTSIPPAIFPSTLWHFVGGNPDEYVIDMQFKDTSVSGLGVHQLGYGYDTHLRSNGSYYAAGAAWSELNENTIDVSRSLDDTMADNIRIRIWPNSNPDYDSGWETLNAGKEIDLEHNLGGNPDNYVLDLVFWDGSPSGPNKIFYGGNTYFETDGTPIRLGSYWFNLNEKSVKVYREDENVSASQIKMRIWIKGSKPIPPAKSIYLPTILKRK